jgi:hypothetical protein
MPKQPCVNCGHEVTLGVSPKNYVAGIYHYRETGILLKTKDYSKQCFVDKCACANPKVGPD